MPNMLDGLLQVSNKQWGYATRSGVGDTTFTFPISFSTIYCVNAGRYFSSRDSSNSGFGVMSQSTTTCVTYTGASQTKAMTILAIGKQQWGRTGSINGDTTKTITYPIAYTSAFYSIALVATDNSSDWNTEISGTPSTSSVAIVVRGKQRSNVYWISVGKQQWGKVASFAIYNSATFTYPISCSTCYVVSATTGSTGETALQITSAGKSSCTIYRHYSGSAGGSGIAYVIVICKQQWGYRKVSTNAYTNLNISYSSSHYIVLISFANNAYGDRFGACYLSATSLTKNSWSLNYADTVMGGGYNWISIGVQQWGYSASAGEGTRKMTFPIAFTSYCLNVQGTGSNVSSQATVAWSGLSTTSFNLIIGSSGAIYYIAIGYQQWGYTSGEIATYPIAFSVAYCGVGMRFGKSGYTGVHSITTTTITFGYEGNAYIVIGKQQWGAYINGNNTFPIAFSSSCYAIAACGESDWSGNDVTVISKTNTTVKVSREHSNTLNTYVAIGI